MRSVDPASRSTIQPSCAVTDAAWGITWTGRDAPLGRYVEADFFQGGQVDEAAYTLGGEGHRLIVGPTGSGKFQAAICPMLLSADHASIVVFDIASGEAARDTGPWRQTVGPVLTLDPYKLASDGADALNPLDALGVDDGGMLTRARSLADAIMMLRPNQGGNADYFNGQARAFLVALLIHVKTWPLETDRTLARVRELIRGPVHDVTDKATGEVLRAGMDLGAMEMNRAADRYVSDAAVNMQEDIDLTEGKNFFYVRQTLRENTEFLDEPEIRAVTGSTTLDLRKLRERIATLYVVAPSSQLTILGRWLRLVYACLLPAMQRPENERQHADGTGVPLHIILDEFAAFGSFTRVTNDMATVRKYGIQMHLAVQKLSQLEDTYGKGWETFVPRYLHVLGSDEQMTSEYVSKRIGTHLVKTKSTSHDRRSAGGSQGETQGQTREPFKHPHDIGGMPASRCYVVIAGSPKLVDLRKWWTSGDTELLRRKKHQPARVLPPRPAGTITRSIFTTSPGHYRF